MGRQIVADEADRRCKLVLLLKPFGSILLGQEKSNCKNTGVLLGRPI